MSFYIIAFNQSLFIEQAIRSVLAQDYSPLEIIVSDDYSTDDTWEKICAIASEYIGPHNLKIRRNSINLGVCAHINLIWKSCNGDWVVASAGDDYSAPNRVSTIMTVVSQNPKVKLVQSWLNEIDEAGNLISVNKLRDNYPHGDGSLRVANIFNRCTGDINSYHGAAIAYSKDVIKQFPRLPDEVIFEDNIINFRAELLGDVCWLRTPLVNHRNHPGQLTQNNINIPFDLSESRKKKGIISDEVSLKQNLEDIDLAWRNQFINEEIYENLRDLFQQNLLKAIELKKTLYGLWPITVIHYLRLRSYGGGNSKDILFRSISPKWFYRFILFPFRKVLTNSIIKI